jgi:hypothetical protein
MSKIAPHFAVEKDYLKLEPGRPFELRVRNFRKTARPHPIGDHMMDRYSSDGFAVGRLTTVISSRR